MTKEVNKRIKKILWTGKNMEDGSIAYNYMYQNKKDAEYNFFDVRDYYKIIKVLITEIER